MHSSTNTPKRKHTLAYTHTHTQVKTFINTTQMSQMHYIQSQGCRKVQKSGMPIMKSLPSRLHKKIYFQHASTHSVPWPGGSTLALVKKSLPPQRTS